MDPMAAVTGDMNNAEADEHQHQLPYNKLRLMCSYGGHIIPTPHEKSLRYIGGETRMVAVDRRSSLGSITSRLSSSLLYGRRNFSLKYQLPAEDLDNLVSLTSDEDLENLVEEYDRTTAASAEPRIRLFVFFAKPEKTASMGSLLADAKSETWFVDALNGATLLPRGLSDSAAIDQLLDLDGRDHQLNTNVVLNKEAVAEVFGGMSTSPVMENSSSSFGSSSSNSPSMSNKLPPLRVRVEENGRLAAGIDYKFAQMSVSKRSAAFHSDAVLQNVDCSEATNLLIRAVGGSDQEEERLDRGNAAQVGFRKPPLPTSLPTQHKGSLSYNLPSPDSATRDTSTASVTSHSNLTFYQDPVQIAGKENKFPPPGPVDPEKEFHESGLMQHQETAYIPSQQSHNFQIMQQQQQLVLAQYQLQQMHQQYTNASVQLVHETATAQIPLSEQSQQQLNTHSQGLSAQIQMLQHLQETGNMSSPQSRDDQQNLQHQFTNSNLQQVFETPTTCQGPTSEPLQNLQQQVYHAQTNQPPISEQLLEQQKQQLQQSQQQFFHGSMEYIHQPPTGQIPMSSYYSLYATQQQQQQHQTMYMLPVGDRQPYAMVPHLSNNISDMPPFRLPTPRPASVLPATAAAYQETFPPVYSDKTSIEANPETTSSVILMSTKPTLFQAPSNQPPQQQQQYVSYSQFHQSMASPVTYGYEYTSKDSQPQVYYTNQQQPGVTIPATYQNQNLGTTTGVTPSSEAVSPPPADQH